MSPLRILATPVDQCSSWSFSQVRRGLAPQPFSALVSLFRSLCPTCVQNASRKDKPNQLPRRSPQPGSAPRTRPQRISLQRPEGRRSAPSNTRTLIPVASDDHRMGYPRVRGDIPGVRPGADERRSIPAGAEPTSPRSQSCTGRGTSPRARGRQRAPVLVLLAVGAITACTGLTMSPCTQCSRRWGNTRVCWADFFKFILHVPSCRSYSRVCGANPTAYSEVPNELELSPHARGRHSLDALQREVDGAIPSSAGLTPVRWSAQTRPRGYPPGTRG
ncbi:hypothetical protein SAMN06272781_5476 [Streptomyces sp. 1222.2]|nr:hypothetical protein SAMN06272781_5476 [Streptomyces sp. 1222.2]